MMPKNARVLIVDDDPDIRSNVRDILNDLGYFTDVADDGPAALRLVEKSSYDVVLLDFKMPGIDGATVYSRIKKMRPETVAIMVTGFADNNGVQRALDAGTWRVLRKPVDVAEMLSLIEDAVEAPLVLVVDDDGEFCENLWQLLRTYDFRVSIASSVKDALAIADTISCQAAVVDMRLADGSGQQVVDWIRKAQPNTRVVVISGSFEELSSAQNADIALVKPVDFEQLIANLK